MESPEDDGVDLALQLAFSFLKWEELLESVDLVCKRWHRIAATDAVWKRYCDEEMDLMKIRRFNQRLSSPDSEYSDEISHTLMARELESQPRLAYRDIFITSKRMGDALGIHRLRGPDSTLLIGERDQRSLRDSCLIDFHWNVHPTIGVLRNLFGEPRHLETNRFSLDTQRKNEMKKRLLDFARKDPLRKEMLKRGVFSLEKEDLARRASEYLLASVTLKDKRPDDLIFSAQSLGVTFGQMIEKFELVAGKETTLTLLTTVLTKHTPRGFEREISFDPPVPGRPLCEMDWPLSPSDTLYFLIQKLWPDKLDLDFTDNGDEEWDRAVRQWWLCLAEPIREALVDILRRGVAGLHVPEFENSIEVPLETLHFIASLPLFRHRLERKIWEEMRTEVHDSLLDIYLMRSRVFLDAIAREYSCVYGDGDTEMNAKLLLQIFLEVPPHRDGATFPALTREYCQNLPTRIENDMNRWNELAETSWSDVAVLRNPETVAELNALASKFKDPFKRIPPKEFQVESMVMRFLYSVLAPPEYIPKYHDLRKRAEDMVKEVERMFKDGVLQVPQEEFEPRYREWLDGVVRDFTIFRDHIFIREQAMLALIPMMQHLSSTDSKKLIYAVFIQQNRDGPEQSFSNDHFGRRTFPSETSLRCGQGQDADNIRDIISWIKNDTDSSFIGKHGTLARLFGLPLPRNIVAAMADFFVERLYQEEHPYGVDNSKVMNAVKVLPFLERSTQENPGNAPLVWECLDQALQNAIFAVLGVREGTIGDNERRIYTNVIQHLLAACIITRALPVLPTIRRVYEGTQFAVLTQQMVPLDTLLAMLHADSPRIELNAENFYRQYEY